MSAKPVPNHQSHHFVQITTFFSLSLSPPPFSPFIHKKPYTSVLLPQQPPGISPLLTPALLVVLLFSFLLFFSLFFFDFRHLFLSFSFSFSLSLPPPSNSFKLLQTSSNFFKLCFFLLDSERASSLPPSGMMTASPSDSITPSSFDGFSSPAADYNNSVRHLSLSSLSLSLSLVSLWSLSGLSL